MSFDASLNELYFLSIITELAMGCHSEQRNKQGPFSDHLGPLSLKRNTMNAIFSKFSKSLMARSKMPEQD